MRIVITGCAGFIGFHLAAHLLPEHEVLGIDNIDSYYSTKLKHARVENLIRSSNFKFREMDIQDYQGIKFEIQKFQPDAVVHLAAQAGVRLPTNQYHKYFSSNLRGFDSVLSCVVEENIPDFLYASSSSVYGDNSIIPFTENQKIVSPSSLYGNTKLLNEYQAASVSKKFGIRTRGLRFFSVYGPWGRPDMAYFRICSSLLGNSEFKLYGDGTIKRDFTYIDDVVEISNMLLVDLRRRENYFHDIVNIGGGEEISINDLVRIFNLKLAKKLNIIQKAADIADVKITKANNEYLFSIIGEYKYHSVDYGVDRFIEWAEQNKDLIKDIGY